MRDKDTSAMREIFQYSSLVKKPLDQCKIATNWRPFQIQDKSMYGLVKLSYSGENLWRPCNFWVTFLYSALSQFAHFYSFFKTLFMLNECWRNFEDKRDFDLNSKQLWARVPSRAGFRQLLLVHTIPSLIVKKVRFPKEHRPVHNS